MKPIKSPWMSLFLLALLIVVPSLLWINIQINNAFDRYFPKDDPTVVFEQQIRTQFPDDEVLIAVFEGKDLFTDQSIKAIDQLSRYMENNELVDRVISLTTLEHIAGSEDGFEVTPLLQVSDNLTPEARRQKVLTDRFAPKLLVSESAEVVTLLVRPVSLSDSRTAAGLQQSFRDQISTVGLDQQFRGFTGDVAMDVALFHSLISENGLFVPVGISLAMLLLWWMFRRMFSLLVISLTLLAANSCALGAIALSGEPFTMPVSMVSPLVTAMSVALLIHLFNAIVYASKRGLHGSELILTARNNIERPARYTTITTILGFASLGLSPLPPIQVFGLAAAVGIAIIYFIVIMLLPAIIARWDSENWATQSKGMTWVNKLVQFLSHLSIRHAGITIFAVVSILLVGAITQLPKLIVETDNFLLFNTDHPLIVSSNIIENNLSGITALEVVFNSNTRDELTSPIRLNTLQEFKTQALLLPEVDYATSMGDIIEDMHWAFNAEDPLKRVIPENQRLIKQYLFTYDGEDLYDLVDQELQQTRLTLSVNVHGAREIQTVIDKLEGILQTLDTDMTWQFTGAGTLFADLEKLLLKSQLYSGFAAFTLIFLCLAWFWRSFSVAMLCMLPNIAPILVIFIVMVLSGITLNIGTAVVSSLTLGVAVDDTIHLYQNYYDRIKKGARPVAALLRAYKTSGRAITATTLILCAQFFIMVPSDFFPTSQFGLMTGVGLLTALIFDLLLLPAILILLNNKQRSTH